MVNNALLLHDTGRAARVHGNESRDWRPASAAGCDACADDLRVHATCAHDVQAAGVALVDAAARERVAASLPDRPCERADAREAALSCRRLRHAVLLARLLPPEARPVLRGRPAARGPCVGLGLVCGTLWVQCHSVSRCVRFSLCGFYLTLVTVTGQLWSISTTTLQVRIRVQLNTILFAKTLVRKDIASSAAAKSTDDTKTTRAMSEDGEEEKDKDEFSSKAQIMTLMTTDVDRVSEFAWHSFALFGVCSSIQSRRMISHYFIIDSPIEIAIGTIFLYDLLGASISVL